MSNVIRTYVCGGLEVRVYNDGTTKAVQRQGQWAVVLDGSTYEAVNPDPALGADPFAPDFPARCNGRFYRMRPGKYGEPLVEQEPTLGLPLPPGLHYVDALGKPATVDPGLKTHGVVCCKAGDPTPVVRASFSNLVKQGIPYALNADGTFIVGGTTWYIHAFVFADKGRIINPFALCGETPVAAVQIRELGDVAYLLLQ